MIPEKITRMLRIGDLLLLGPETIHARDNVGYCYLEAAVTIQWRCRNHARWLSLRIYCDASGGDDQGYLPPLLRTASWERQDDRLLTQPSWPNVSVELTRLPQDSAELHAAVRRLQEVADQPALRSYGLATRRDFGDWLCDERGFLMLEINSGLQKVARDFQAAEAPELYEATSALEATVRKLAQPVEEGAWLECYEGHPADMSALSPWYWDGRTEPPATLT